MLIMVALQNWAQSSSVRCERLLQAMQPSGVAEQSGHAHVHVTSACLYSTVHAECSAVLPNAGGGVQRVKGASACAYACRHAGGAPPLALLQGCFHRARIFLDLPLQLHTEVAAIASAPLNVHSSSFK